MSLFVIGTLVVSLVVGLGFQSCERHATEPVNTTQLAEFDAQVPAP